MKLFSTHPLGGLELRNRMVMSPMTRCRALGNRANALMAEYYGQRAGAGLIVTEGTSPSPNGLGYARIPGLFSADQTASWRRVTEAVHARGGRIFVQLMHAGRVGHPLNLPEGAELLAPSAVAVSVTMWTDSQGEQPCGVPREMTPADVEKAVEEYARAARNALAAGFDGVELHGANGYLIDQFLNPAANRRTDAYGGDGPRRNRFALEVARRAAAAIGPERVGIRVSPYGVFNDMGGAFEGIEAQYGELASALGRLGLAYVHLVDHSSMGAPKPEASTVGLLSANFRAAGGRAVILSGGYERERAEADLASGAADLVAFGRPFLANPDLVERLRAGATLNAPDLATFYTPGPEGYTDYPALGG
ncbi:MAG: alkene reductase [Deltaproteobacteria bacterium]|nr:alkene reductase [Deltaproteobacteria bacterium]